MPREVYSISGSSATHAESVLIDDFLIELNDRQRRQSLINEFENVIGEELIKRKPELGASPREAAARAGVWVEPTPARTYDEVESTKTMLDRTERHLGLKPKRLAADTAYGNGRFWVGWLVTELHRTFRSAMPASATMDGPLASWVFGHENQCDRVVVAAPSSHWFHLTNRILPVFLIAVSYRSPLLGAGTVHHINLD